MKVYIKNIFKGLGILIPISTMVAVSACSSPVNDVVSKKSWSRKKLSSYYKDHAIPKTLLDGGLIYDPQKFDELKKQKAKTISIVKHNGIIEADSDTFQFILPGDVYSKGIPWLKNDADLMSFAKLYSLEESIKVNHQKAIFDFNYISLSRSKNAGSTVKTHIYINLIFKNGLFDTINDQSLFNVLRTLIHENNHKIFYENNLFKEKEMTYHNLHYKNGRFIESGILQHQEPNNKFIKHLLSDIINKDPDFIKLIQTNFKWFENQLATPNWDYYYNINMEQYWRWDRSGTSSMESLSPSKGLNNSFINEMFAEITSYFLGTTNYKNTDGIDIGAWEVINDLYRYNYNLADDKKPDQAENIMSSIFKNVFNVSSKEYIYTNYKKNGTNKLKINLASAGTKFTQDIDKLVVEYQGKTFEKTVNHKILPFGFHGRPFDDQYDYKYIANAASIDIEINQKVLDINNVKFKIILKDGSEVPTNKISIQHTW